MIFTFRKAGFKGKAFLGINLAGGLHSFCDERSNSLVIGTAAVENNLARRENAELVD